MKILVKAKKIQLTASGSVDVDVDKEEEEEVEEVEEEEVEWRPQQTRPARHAQLSSAPLQSNCSMFGRLVKAHFRSH